MEIQFINLNSIEITDRARKDFDKAKITDLADSIADKEVGLINPILVMDSDNGNYKLIAGETRTRAIKLLNNLGNPYYFNKQILESGTIPAIVTENLSELEQAKRELDENIHRKAFTWQEEAKLRKRILLLEQRKAAKLNIENLDKEQEVELLATAKKPELDKTLDLLGKRKTPQERVSLRKSVELAIALEDKTLEPEFKPCKTKKEALRVLEREKRRRKNEILSKEIGKTYSSDRHKIYKGNCLEVLKQFPENHFQLCITDPPYGINAQNFGDSDGRLSGFKHTYNDSPEYWAELMPKFLKELDRVMAEKCHIYLACDIKNFFKLGDWLKKLDWQVQRTPIIEVREFGRVPVIDFYYRRSYDIWLYARKGGKKTNVIRNDVIFTKKDVSERHAAKKGEEIIRTFLEVSGEVRGKLIDPFAGSGSILNPCHTFGIDYYGIELDEATYGELANRLKILKEEEK